MSSKVEAPGAPPAQATTQGLYPNDAEKDEEETESFKAFIDNINPDDFSKYLDAR